MKLREVGDLGFERWAGLVVDERSVVGEVELGEDEADEVAGVLVDGGGAVHVVPPAPGLGDLDGVEYRSTLLGGRVRDGAEAEAAIDDDFRQKNRSVTATSRRRA
ncbi:MAG: hypothetical protein R2749_09335 [Acidimicrobiales bacterium]